MSAGYFAFVRRDAARRYHASVPDFDGCSVDCDRVGDVADAVRAAIRAEARRVGWPPPTSLEKLPRQPDDHDGYWLMVEVDSDA